MKAADEIERLAVSDDGETLIGRDDAITLELVTMLERFRPSSARAARIFVDRYGMKTVSTATTTSSLLRGACQRLTRNADRSLFMSGSIRRGAGRNLRDSIREKSA